MAFSKMLSVIVPVYDVRCEYLGDCFESILGQSFSDFELIIVDDGAGEDIARFIDGYDYKNKDVRIIRQENAGVSAARNEGLKVCSGKYVTFVDSDDTIEPDCFEKTVDFAERNSLDVLMFGITRVFEKRSIPFSPYVCDIPLFSGQQKEEVQYKCLVGILPFYRCPPASADAAGSACAKLYNTEFLKSRDLYYTPGLVRAEDMEFNLRVFHKAEKIGYLYSMLYNYRQLETSATYVYRDKGIDVFTRSLNAIHGHIDAISGSALLYQIYYMRCMFFYLESMDMDYLNPANPKPFRERIKELKAAAQTEPYKEAFCNLTGENLTFARKIPLFLIRHGMFVMLAIFYGFYRKIKI